ncbi:hypothetical protein Zmor_028069 [Zophobas morio]|uniref:Ionotropic glutamate receptor L-glutamate and glycine-binding domain-containing protein n=1 Tax=Zophobas morio TaxID=2755281 RepID=A0AA38HQF1_9CUCU|nr:hypothetical protein Zmor_028069 [Zophobas morio]
MCSVFRLIIHIDNTTKEVAKDILDFPSIIFNHDVPLQKLNYYSSREKHLHVTTFTNTPTFKKLLQSDNYIGTSDIIIVLVEVKSLKEFSRELTNSPNLSKSKGIYIVSKHPHVTKIYSICFYCGKISAQLKLLQKVELGKPLKTPLDNFENFSGHELRIIYTDYFPFIYCVDKIVIDREVVCQKAIGWEHDMLEVLSHKLNFTYKLIEVPSKHLSHDGIIKELISGSVDFSIGGLSITYDRYKNLQFSSVFNYEQLGFMFVYQKSFFQRLFTYELFTLNYDFTIAATIVLLSVGVFLVVRNFDQVRLPFGRIFLMFVGSSLEQAFNLSHFRVKYTESTVRVVLISYWFLCIIVNTIFKSKLLALMVSTPTHQITIPEFLEQKYELVIDRSRGSVKLFVDLEEVLLANFPKTYKNNVCEFIDYAASHKALLYGELGRITLHSKVQCPNSTISEKVDTLTTQTVGLDGHAWLFQKDFPFVDQFNVHIRKVISGGLLSTWKQKALLAKNIYIYSKRITSTKNENIIGLSNLERAGGVAVVNYAENIELYTICFYCGDVKGKMTLLQKSSYDQPLDIEFLFSTNFKNFGGHLFKVAYIDYLPYMYCSQKTRLDNITLCNEALGSEFLLLQTLSNYLNFTYQLIETPSDFYDNLVDQVTLKDADFALGGVSATNRRMESLRFADVLRFEPFGLFYVFQKPFLSKLFEYELKNLILELFLLVVMFFLSLLVFFLDKKCTKLKLSLVDIFMIFLKSKYEQSANVKTGDSVIFVSWWIFALIVNVIYRSMLVSLMVQKPVEHVTLQDLVDQGYEIVLQKNTTYMQIFLEPEERLINRSTTLLFDKCEILPYVQTNKALVPAEFAMTFIHKINHCSTDRHSVDIKKFTKEVFSVTPHAWPFRPETPFIDEFNIYIQKLLNGAVLKMWENRVLIEKNIYPFTEKTVPKQEKNVIDFESFLLHFLVYLVLIMVSIFCFLFELLYWWLWGRNSFGATSQNFMLTNANL